MKEILERAREKGYATMPIGKNPNILIVGEPEIPTPEQLEYQHFVLQELTPEVFFHQNNDSMERKPCLVIKAGELEATILDFETTPLTQFSRTDYLESDVRRIAGYNKEQQMAEQIELASQLSLKPVIAVIKSEHLRVMSMIHPYLTDPKRKVSYLCIDQTGKNL